MGPAAGLPLDGDCRILDAGKQVTHHMVEPDQDLRLGHIQRQPHDVLKHIVRPAASQVCRNHSARTCPPEYDDAE